MNAVTDITPIAHIACPRPLRSIQGWLIWRYEPNDNPGGKPRKVPYYAGGGCRIGQQGTREDREHLVTFDAARSAAARRGFNGVGLALLPDAGVVALDFDDCVIDGEVHPDVLAVLGAGYAELSPSGNGVRAFFRGQLGNRKSHKQAGLQFGLEVFSSTGYVTFTGHVLDVVKILGNEDQVPDVTDEVMSLIRKRFRKDLEREAFSTDEPQDVLGLSKAQIATALDALPADLDYDSWLNVGMALHHETGGSEDGFETWDEWSSRSPKYTTSEYGYDRWRSFHRGTGQVVTARSLIHMANEHGAGIDLHGPAGPEEFDVVADDATTKVKKKAARFTPMPFAEFIGRPPPTWIVKGVIPRAGLLVLYGESGSGKSFMALDLGAAVARGVEWRGRRVKQGRVVYIAAEGAGGFRNRCAAYAATHGLEADIPFEVIADQPNLLERDDALALARGIGKADLVIVDTFAQVTAGGNENAGEDMGKALSHCAGIHRATGALVMLVHHSGKDQSRGARGWSGIKAAADAELEVVKTAAGRSMRTSKQKDGDDSLAWGFALEVVPIGVDEDGDAITSCVVIEAEMPIAQPTRVLGPVEQIVNEIIQTIAQSQTKGIEVTALVNEAAAKLPVPEDRKRDTRKQRVRRAIETLCQGDDAPYWLHDDGTIEIV